MTPDGASDSARKRTAVSSIAAGIVLAAVAVAIGLALGQRGSDEGARCGPGFAVRGARCVVSGSARSQEPREAPVGRACPAPLVTTANGCDAPDLRVLVPAASLVIGPSDWEAEGRVRPRVASTGAFRIDAFEVTRGRWASAERGDRRPVGATLEDPARAVNRVSRAEAAAFCAGSGGRLPTEDEWMAAATSAANPPRRYPWGDTGAVCRRAAWGLMDGPCAVSAEGPDTVGSHPAGDSPLGIHDLSGNVAEWVASDPAGSPTPWADTADTADTADAADAANAANAAPAPAAVPVGPGVAIGIVKGGSWQTRLASELRIWARLELPPGAHDPRVGFRCAYPP